MSMNEDTEAGGRLSLRRDGAAAVLLCAAVLAVFGQAVRFDFLAMDDLAVVVDNPGVRPGLSAGGLRFALTEYHFGIWMPVTTLTHLLDVSLFGMRPAGHHAQSLLWHLAAAVLWYLALVRLTGRPGAALAAALLFALHPMRAEAVAWVASRKEVVAGCWFAAAVFVYAGQRGGRPSAARLAAVFCVMVLALLSKPTTLTLPFALLLLDAWPLGRVDLRRPASWVRPVAEKLPLFALCAPAVWLGRAGQASLNALSWTGDLPLSFRAGNALVSYARYLGHTFWPARLMGHYPELRGALTPGMVAGAAALLLAVTAAVLIPALRRGGRPRLLAGWLWFLGTLLPVIGLAGFGNAALADRWAYVAHMGLLAALVFAGAAALKSPRARAVLAAALVAVTAGLGAWQTAFWRNDETLCRRMLEVSGGENAMGRGNLGLVLWKRGDHAGAAEQYREAVRLQPGNPAWLINLAAALNRLERFAEAESVLAPEMRAFARNPRVRMQYGRALYEQDRCREALPHLAAAAALAPEDPVCAVNHGLCLMVLGELERADAAFRRTLALDPGSALARQCLEDIRRAQEVRGN